MKLNLNLAHIYIYVHIMMSGKKLVMVRSSLPTSRGSQYNMQYVGARMHAKWHGVCGLCWWGGGAAELATSAEFRQVKNYRLTFRLAKSEVGSRTVCSVSCVNGPAPPPGNSPEMIKSWPTEGKYAFQHNCEI